MKTSSSAILSGIAALAVVAAVLGISTLAGVPTLTNPTSNISPVANPGTPGTLTVLLTDPPHVPNGVTGVYVTYTNLAVHVADAGNQSGWTTLSTAGAIDLMSTLNVSQTIAAVQVPTGLYNALRFNVTSATVTLNSKNYTSFVANSELFIPIKGGIVVNDSKPSATIIDISPIVMNIGSSSNPEFVIRSAATAYAVPSV